MKKVLSFILCMAIVMSFAVSASALKSIKVKSISLDKSSITLTVGKTYNLKVIFKPVNTTQKLLKFSTSDKNVAEVDRKGKITAVKAGKAVITVVSASNKKIIAKCNITILEDYGDTGGLKLPITDKPVKLSLICESDLANVNETFAFKELAKRTGVQLDVMAIPSAVIREKMSVMLASGNIPDLVPGATKVMGNLGALADINKYKDELPNYKSLMSKYPGYQKSYGADNGAMYFFPVYDQQRDVNFGFMYRKDIFDKNGIKPWTNTEEFYQALKKLKEIYPDSFPYASKAKEMIFVQWSASWGLSCWNLNNGPMYYDEKSKVWKYAGADPKFKNMLDFMKKLYNEKLIDPEFITDSQAGWETKLTVSNKSFVTNDWIGRLDELYEKAKATMPDYNLRYGNPIGLEQKIRRPGRSLATGLAVKNNEKAPTALKLLDYLLSPSGSKLMTMGVEGKTYNKDASGNITYSGITSPTVGLADLRKQFGLFLFTTRFDRESVYYKFSKKEQEAQNMADEVEAEDPVVTFTEKEEEIFQTLMPKVSTATLEFASKYVIDPKYGENEWQDWVNKSKTNDSKTVLDIYNAAQKRYDAK